MTVKIKIFEFIDKEFENHIVAVPFTPEGGRGQNDFVFGSDDLDTIYYNPDTDKITIYLSHYHTGYNAKNTVEAAWSINPALDKDSVTIERDSNRATLFSFTPLAGKNDYTFINYIIFNIGDTESQKPPMYVQQVYVAANFTFER